MRKVRVDLQADIAVFTVGAIVKWAEGIGSTLYVLLAEGFVDGFGTVALLCKITNGGIVSVAVGNGFLENRGIGGDAA